MAARAAITIDEFELLPAALAENSELIDGELVDVSGNTPLHNRLRDLLVILLTPLVEPRGLGLVISEQEFDFEGNAHGPDVALIDADRVASLNLRKRVQRFVPVLAIEIVSNNDTFNGIVTKAARYLRCGTHEVWVISPEIEEVFMLSSKGRTIVAGKDRLETTLVPGFSIGVGELFDRVLHR